MTWRALLVAGDTRVSLFEQKQTLLYDVRVTGGALGVNTPTNDFIGFEFLPLQVLSLPARPPSSASERRNSGAGQRNSTRADRSVTGLD